MSDADNPMHCSPPGSSVHGILQAEYWSGLPFPSPGDLPDPGIELRSPALQADSLPTELRRELLCLFISILLYVLSIDHPPQLKFHVFLFSEALDHSTVPGTEQKSRKKELICGIEQMTFLFPGFYFFICKRKGLDHFRLFSKTIISGTVFFQKVSYTEP